MKSRQDYIIAVKKKKRRAAREIAQEMRMHAEFCGVAERGILSGQQVNDICRV